MAGARCEGLSHSGCRMSSVGQVAGGIIGATIGFFISGGNPMGAVYGAQIGMTAGALIDPPKGPTINMVALTEPMSPARRCFACNVLVSLRKECRRNADSRVGTAAGAKLAQVLVECRDARAGSRHRRRRLHRRARRP